jgi:hypothetical protein
VAELVRAGLTAALASGEAMMDSAVKGDKPAQAVAAIVGYHLLGDLAHEIEPRLEGDRLVSEYQLPRLTGDAALVPWLGMAASLAIPSFTKYLNQAKTMEAQFNLGRLREGVIAYYGEHHTRDGRRFAFPPSTGWTPAAACCGQPGDRCAADVGAYSGATWQALHFGLSESHHYQYRFSSEGRGERARFTVEARGDLDCDGRWSHFQIRGSIARGGELKIEELVATDELE